MIKPFLKLLERKKNYDSMHDSKMISEDKVSKSKPLIIAGSIISISSIFLLLFTINNRFGWFK